jgi:hypothetical protein
MFLGSKVKPVRKADNLTAIFEPIVYTMWDILHLTTLLVCTACYGDGFAFYEEMVTESQKFGLISWR